MSHSYWQRGIQEHEAVYIVYQRNGLRRKERIDINSPKIYDGLFDKKIKVDLTKEKRRFLLLFPMKVYCLKSEELSEELKKDVQQEGQPKLEELSRRPGTGLGPL